MTARGLVRALHVVGLVALLLTMAAWLAFMLAALTFVGGLGMVALALATLALAAIPLLLVRKKGISSVWLAWLVWLALGALHYGTCLVVAGAWP